MVISRSFAKNILALVSILFLSQTTLAQNQCAQFFSEKKLRIPTMDWVKKERSKAVAYIRNSKVGKSIEALLRAESQPEKNLIAPLETENFRIDIIDRGLAPRKPVDVVYLDKKTNESQVLLSSLKLENRPDVPTVTKFKNNNTVIPVDAQLSPLKDYLLVRVSAKGSLDIFTIVVIDLKSKKIISEIENVSASSTVWLTPRQFTYKERKLNNDIILVNINEQNQVATQIANDRRISGSDDQQWFYGRSSADEYTIASSTQKFAFRLPLKSRIDGIFKSSVGTLWIKTEGENGFYEILKVKLENTNTANPKITMMKVVAESKMVIEDVEVKDNYMVVSKYLGKDRLVEIRDLNGQLIKDLKIPDCCSYGGVSLDAITGEIKINLSSPIQKKQAWIFSPRSKQWFLSNVEGARIEQNPETYMLRETSSAGEVEYITEYKAYRSKDGTEIPIRVTYKKGLVFNGEAKTLMEVYGGFASNNYFHPFYSRMTFEFIKSGGVHLAPAVRGSYFFGRRWHDEGRALNKPNSIYDTIAATEWAIKANISKPENIAITGDSHGGLVVGAVVSLRPDLYGLAFPRFGPLVFHEKPTLDPLTTPLQIYEYGDLIKDPQAIAMAQGISPFLNIRKGKFPMTVVVTGRNDSRVNPEHSYLYANKLMEAQEGDASIFLYTNSNSGHWMASIARQDFLGWRTTADYWTVIFEYFKMKLQ